MWPILWPTGRFRPRRGQLQHDHGAIVRRGLDLEAAPDHGCALSHARQPLVSLGDEAARVRAPEDALAVVSHGHAQPVGVLRQPDGDLRGIGVLDGIVQRFLCDPVYGQGIRSGRSRSTTLRVIWRPDKATDTLDTPVAGSGVLAGAPAALRRRPHTSLRGKWHSMEHR